MSEDQKKIKPFLIGICGGSASGKTTAAFFITKYLGEENCLLFSLDNYYYGPNDEERKHIENYNFDRPEALDLDLAYKHLNQLINSETIDMPVYSFNVSKRMNYTQKVSPKKVIIFEGIFSLYEKRMRDLMNLKLFFDLDSDIRLFRRISRDISDRSRVLETVLDRYLTFVKPAFDYYIKPTRKYADIVITQGTYNSLPIEIISQYLNSFLKINYKIEESMNQSYLSLNSNQCTSREFFCDKKEKNLFIPEEEKDITKFNKIINYLIKRLKISYYKIFITEIIDHLLQMVNKLNSSVNAEFLDGRQLSSQIEAMKAKFKDCKEKKIINIFVPILLKAENKVKSDISNFIKEIKGENIQFQILSVYLSEKCFNELNKISNEQKTFVNFVSIYFGDNLLKHQTILENGGFVVSNEVDLGLSVHFLSSENFIAEFQKKLESHYSH